MSDLGELINDPGMCLMIGISFGFFLRSRIAKENEESLTRHYSTILNFYKSRLEKKKGGEGE